MTRRYPQTHDGDTIEPRHSGYRMACCDCGLVHLLTFRVVKKTDIQSDGSYIPEPIDDSGLQVQLTVYRKERNTAARRRWMRLKGWTGIR